VCNPPEPLKIVESSTEYFNNNKKSSSALSLLSTGESGRRAYRKVDLGAALAKYGCPDSRFLELGL
jgi:hypothetical protein